MRAGSLLIGLGRGARQCWRAPRQAGVSLRLTWWLLLTSLLAGAFSLSRTQRFLSRRAASSGLTSGVLSRDTAPGDANEPSPERLAQAIDAILSLDLPILRGGRCWKRALVLQRFLARQGIDCRVTFGARRAREGGIEAHAWLERDGRPFLERTTETYTAIFSLTLADALGVARSNVTTGETGAMEAMDSTETTRTGAER